MNNLSWDIPPDILEVYSVLEQIGELEAALEDLEYQLKKIELPVRLKYPRKPELRDEASLDIQRQMSEVKGLLKKLNARQKALDLHVRMFNAIGYHLR